MHVHVAYVVTVAYNVDHTCQASSTVVVVLLPFADHPPAVSKTQPLSEHES